MVGGITTKAALDALERSSLALQVPKRTAAVARVLRRPRGAAPIPSRASLVLPPPQDGCTYSAAEVGAICHVNPDTVRNWIACGRRAGGQTTYLEALTVPAGRVAPEALCSFLSRNNHVDVSVSPPPGVNVRPA